MGTPSVRCPDCHEVLAVPSRAPRGDIVECPNCAGHTVRLTKEGDHWAAKLAHQVSCPACEKVLTVADDAKPGDVVECCGRHYRLTFEWGAFAAEEFGNT
jgi:ribosomal protein S27E